MSRRRSSPSGYRLLFRKINRLREGLILKRVVKRHLLGARIRENAAKTRGEGVVQTIIGPESEETALNEAAPEVAGQLGTERHQALPHAIRSQLQRLDDKKRGDFLVLQHG